MKTPQRIPEEPKMQGADGVDVSFDVAPPGQDGAFKTYTSGRMRRQK